MNTQTIDIASPPSPDQSIADAIAELTRLLQEGCPVDLETFIAEHPACSDRLRELAPTMQVLYDLGYSPECATAGLPNSAASPLSERPGEGLLNLNGEPGAPNSAATARTLGDFCIIREIGRGGMGVVYEAEQISLGRRVALKVLPFASMLDERQLQRFKNEARAAATLNHPNIVPVHAVGCERGVHFYAMQYIEGQTLAAVIDGLKDEGTAKYEVRSTKDESQASLPSAEGTERAGEKVASVGNALCGVPEAPGDIASAAELRPSTFVLHPSADTVRDLAAALSTLRETKPRDFYRRIAELGIQAAEALDHAHQLGIVHRDIKPANLLVECSHLARSHLPGAPGRDEASQTPTPSRTSMFHHAERDDYTSLTTDHRPLTTHLFITDFGLARLPTDAAITLTGDLLGTLRYMSPEQSEGKSAVLDHRTDIYSLGITLYELLTLRPAFPADDRQTLLKQITEEEPRDPRKLNPAIPADLETIVLKAIEKNPVDRYPSAAALAGDLRRFLAREPIHARPPGLTTRARKWSRRHRAVLSSALATLFVSMAVSTLFVTGAYRRERQQREVAETAQNRAQTSLDLARAAVDDMYTKVATVWLAKETAISNIQEQFLTRALEVYQQLAQQPATDAASCRDAAVAFERIGEIEHFLGHSQRAVRAMEQSIALEQSVLDSGDSSSEVTAALAARHRKLANVQLTLARLNDARQSYTAGLHYAQSTADRDPAPLDHRLELALYRLLGSELAGHAGSVEEAESLARHAAEDLHALCREDDSRLDMLVARLKAQLSLVAYLRRLSRLDEAEKQGEATLNMMRNGLLAEHNFHDARELVQLQAEAHDQLASVFVDLRKSENAADHLRQALALKQQNLKAQQRPVVFIVAASFYNRFNFSENYELVPFCSYTETQLGLAEVLASLGRRDEAEQLLGECVLTANMLCSGEPGHDLRYLLLYGRTWAAAADLMAAEHPQDVVHLQNAADAVWLAIGAYFPQAIDQADVPSEVRQRIAWHAEHGAAHRRAVERDRYKDLPPTPAWQTAFVRQALASSWAEAKKLSQ